MNIKLVRREDEGYSCFIARCMLVVHTYGERASYFDEEDEPWYTECIEEDFKCHFDIDVDNLTDEFTEDDADEKNGCYS